MVSASDVRRQNTTKTFIKGRNAIYETARSICNSPESIWWLRRTRLVLLPMPSRSDYCQDKYPLSQLSCTQTLQHLPSRKHQVEICKMPLKKTQLRKRHGHRQQHLQLKITESWSRLNHMIKVAIYKDARSHTQDDLRKILIDTACPC